MIKREERNIITNNLKSLFSQQTKTRKEIADAIGVKYSTFCDWFRGRTSPDANQVKLLANYFKVSIAEIIEPKTGVSMISNSQILDSKTLVTIHKEVIRKDGTTTHDTDYEYVDKYIVGPQDVIGFKLNDDSMEPEYHKGDVIIATKIKYLTDNGDYLFDLGVDDEWFPELRLARVWIRKNDIIIAPLNYNNNKDYEEIHTDNIDYLNRFRGIYKIVQLIRTYK